MCFSSSRCWPWMAGAAVDWGRMLPACLLVEDSGVGSWIERWEEREEEGERDIRSIRSSFCGRRSRLFLRLSVASWRSSSRAVDCKELFLFTPQLALLRSMMLVLVM
jgi:hypothetical protein